MDEGPNDPRDPIEQLQAALEASDAADAPDIAEAIAATLGERLDPDAPDPAPSGDEEARP
jgi:uncharacterized protein (DUF2267 family)